MSSADSTGHDTGLYDPSVHDNQIVAMYESDADAHSAQQALTAAGVSDSAIQVVARGTAMDTATRRTTAEDQGIWGAIKSLFVPDDDRSDYTHAIGRGHAMLIVTPMPGVDRNMIIHTIENTHPIDFDARLEEWRQTGYDTSIPHHEYTAATGCVTPTVGAAATVATTATAAATAPMTAAAKNDDTIEVVGENLRAAKREVIGVADRIRSYVVKKPAEAQGRLHEERVTGDRHPVDRPANPADMAAFQERTTEARAASEEAVIGKEARVVEEIGLYKTAPERLETSHDTVRKAEAEATDDTPKTGMTGTNTAGSTTTPTSTTPSTTPSTIPGTIPGTTTPGGITGPVATSGATTSGMNAPRR